MSNCLLRRERGERTNELISTFHADVAPRFAVRKPTFSIGRLRANKFRLEGRAIF